MPRDIDYYALLGVNRDASEAEIRERFRTLAREAHPDRAPPERRAEAEGKFQELAEAVNVLTQPGAPQGLRLRALDGVHAGVAGQRDSDSVSQNYVSSGDRSVQGAELRRGRRQLSARRAIATRRTRGRSTIWASPPRARETCGPPSGLWKRRWRIEPQNVRLLKDAGTVFRQAGLLVKAEKAYSGGGALGSVRRRSAPGSRRHSGTAGRQGSLGRVCRRSKPTDSPTSAASASTTRTRSRST